MKTEITTENLQKAGWVLTKEDFPMFPIEKVIENRNPLNASEDSDIKLVVHLLYNSKQFAVVFPSGAMLNFTPQSMEDLEAFERMLDFYDPEF